jgi:mono/diheme cytochrome c family protein
MTKPKELLPYLQLHLHLASLLALLMTVGAARAQQPQDTDDIRQGHQLAAMLCGQCHVAAADQRFTPELNPPAPPFATIAQRGDISADWLKTYLATTHRGIDNPKGMPNPYLADYQVRQVTAYLLSLRK